MRTSLVSVGVVASILLAAAAIFVAANRPAVLLAAPSATTLSSITPAILTSGDATVSRKPDLATVTAGIESEQGTAAAAQSDLASKAAKLISRIKSLGVPDQDLSTAGYWVGPVYNPTGQAVTGYRAGEQLRARWHNVDSVGKALDAVVQEGGATNVTVSFGLADPKSAEAEARTLAIGDARAKASAMASAAGVRLGQVIQVSDLGTQSRYPQPYSMGAAQAAPSQVPVGMLDVQVTVEVDFAID